MKTLSLLSLIEMHVNAFGVEGGMPDTIHISEELMPHLTAEVEDWIEVSINDNAKATVEISISEFHLFGCSVELTDPDKIAVSVGENGLERSVIPIRISGSVE